MTTSSLYPTHTIICKVAQSSSEFQTQIPPQRPWRFSNALQSRAPIGRWIKSSKADINYPFEHGEVITYTLDGVSIHGVSIHYKDTGALPNFTMRPMVTLVTEFNGCDRRTLRTDQQHCSYSTILT